jgi:hypothetical protein
VYCGLKGQREYVEQEYWDIPGAIIAGTLGTLAVDEDGIPAAAGGREVDTPVVDRIYCRRGS